MLNRQHSPAVFSIRFCGISDCYFCDFTWGYSRETKYGIQYVRLVTNLSRVTALRRRHLVLQILTRTAKSIPKKWNKLSLYVRCVEITLRSIVSLFFRRSMICSAKRIAKVKIHRRNAWRRLWTNLTWTAIDRWRKMNSSMVACKMIF